MTRKIEVIPAEDDFRLGEKDMIAYRAGRAVISLAAAAHPLDMAVSLSLSGVFRELREHFTIEEVQQILRDFADQMPEVAKGDL